MHGSHQSAFDCRYNYVHLPLDHRTNKNMSMAFINFEDREAKRQFFVVSVCMGDFCTSIFRTYACSLKRVRLRARPSNVCCAQPIFQMHSLRAPKCSGVKSMVWGRTWLTSWYVTGLQHWILPTHRWSSSTDDVSLKRRQFCGCSTATWQGLSRLGLLGKWNILVASSCRCRA